MKLWFRLTLVCCVLLGLFLSLSRAVVLNHRLQIVGSRPGFDRGREPAAAPTVSFVRRMRFDQPRAGPLASLVLDCAWTAGNLGPPGPETPGPPEPIGPWRVDSQSSRQLPSNAPEHTLLHEITGSKYQF
jgi:hypothetical protein